MILWGLVWFSIVYYANVFPCKVSNGLVWWYMVLYGLAHLCTIFVRVYWFVPFFVDFKLFLSILVTFWHALTYCNWHSVNRKSFTPRVLKGFKTARIFANNSKMKDTKQNNIHPDNSKAEKNLSGTLLPNICNKGWGGISRCVWCVCDYNLSSPACWENDIMAYLWLLYTTTRIQTHN